MACAASAVVGYVVLSVRWQGAPQDIDALEVRAGSGVAQLGEVVAAEWRGEFLEHMLHSLLSAHMIQHEKQGPGRQGAPVLMDPVQRTLKSLLKHCDAQRKLAAFKEMYLRTIRATPADAAQVLTQLGKDLCSETLAPLLESRF